MIVEHPLQLDDRALWPDGVISVDPSDLVSFMLKRVPRDRLYVGSLTPEIIEFNQVSDHPIRVRTACEVEVPPSWKLPDPYKYLNLDDYLIGLVERVEKDELYEQRIERLSVEICLFKELKLDDVLRTLIYVLDVLLEKNLVWGVGRGSSCSSYLLYLLGLHEVDPVKYEIELSDFIKIGD